MNSNCRLMAHFALVVSLFSCGCGKPAVTRSEVVGSLTLDSVPVSSAQVILSRKQGFTKQADLTGRYNARVSEGKFKFPLSTGPVPGEYIVSIQPDEPESEEVAEQLKNKQSDLLQSRNQFVGAVARKGPITIAVNANQVSNLQIDLKSKD